MPFFEDAAAEALAASRVNRAQVSAECCGAVLYSLRKAYASGMSSFDLGNAVAALARDGSSYVVASAPGPPLRIDGFTVGAPVLSANPPHRGEMHPDGDELLYLISGRIEVIIEDGGTETTVGTEHVQTLIPGQAFIVPRGAWHRVNVCEPSRLLHITPGPGDGHRPLE